MARRKHRKRKFFTVDEANRMLPLVRAIVRDIVELYQKLQERQERLGRIHPAQKAGLGEAYADECRQAEEELHRDAVRLEEYLDELRRLGVEFKGWDGLVDFAAEMQGREVCLCWKLGEPEVAHWHERDAGFAGRKKLLLESAAAMDAGHDAAGD